jgi:hypothetical protein
VGEPAGPARLVGEEIFDLGVDAPEIVVRPVPQGLEQARIKPEQEALGGGHAEAALRCRASRC